MDWYIFTGTDEKNRLQSKVFLHSDIVFFFFVFLSLV